MQSSLMVYHGVSHESLVFSWYTHKPLGECVYQKNTRDLWDIPCMVYHELSVTILFHAIENTVANIIVVTCAAHDGKVRCNTVEYTMAFLYSDWLYFLWHGTNKYIRI